MYFCEIVCFVKPQDKQFLNHKKRFLKLISNDRKTSFIHKILFISIKCIQLKEICLSKYTYIYLYVDCFKRIFQVIAELQKKIIINK